MYEVSVIVGGIFVFELATSVVLVNNMFVMVLDVFNGFRFMFMVGFYMND